MREIILASASPRRSQLLTQVGIAHQIVPSNYEETQWAATPEKTVLRFAKGKALEVLERVEAGEIVLGSDTVVACDGKILGKPKDAAEAFEMLSLLQGRTHQVFTGVSIVQREKECIQECSFVEETRVSFATMTSEEIREYISTKDPLDKAGAYGIQGPCAAYILGIQGDYYNVVGLPVARVYQELRKFSCIS